MLRVLVDFFKVLPKQAFVDECYPAVFQIPWAGVARSSGTTTLMPLSLVCDSNVLLVPNSQDANFDSNGLFSFLGMFFHV